MRNDENISVGQDDIVEVTLHNHMDDHETAIRDHIPYIPYIPYIYIHIIYDIYMLQGQD